MLKSYQADQRWTRQDKADLHMNELIEYHILFFSWANALSLLDLCLSTWGLLSI
jgi:hypothetical protein